MTWFMGIDIGSGTSKGVMLENGVPKTYYQLSSGVNYRVAAQELRKGLLNKADLIENDINYTITTGHGEGIIPFSDRYVTDMLCCTSGIHYVFPSVRTIIDMQGQSIQVIKLKENGQISDFAVSEVCAGGSGRFIEVIANVLQIDLEDIGDISLKAKNAVTFTTGCAVFGESEAISRVAEGTPKEEILAGVHKAIANEISGLLDRVGIEEECAISGGGGLNIGLIKQLEALGIRLLVPPQPQFINALGAAILAAEEAK